MDKLKQLNKNKNKKQKRNEKCIATAKKKNSQRIRNGQKY